MAALPLRILLPAVIALFALMTTLVIYLANRAVLLPEVEGAAQRQVRDRLNLIQGLGESLLSAGHDGELRRMVASFGAEPELRLAFIADGEGRVVASTRINQIGRPWREALGESAGAVIERVAAHRATELTVAREARRIDGFAAVCGGGERLRRERCGFLFYRHDFGPLLERGLATIVSQALVGAAGMFAGALLLWWVLHRLVTRRADQLVAVTDAYARGDHEVRVGMAGGDELSRVGAALDRMLDRVGDDERALRRQAQAIAESPVMVVITDTDCAIEYVNPAFHRITGYRPEEVAGRRIRLLQSGETPEAVYDEIFAKLQRGESWNGELHDRKKSGALFWVSATISPVRDAAGNVVNFVALEEDITERKRMEEELLAHRDRLSALVEEQTASIKAIVETAADGILTIDDRGRVLSFNPAAERMFGYRAEEMIGGNVSRLMPKPHAAKHDGYMRHYRETGESKILGVGREVVGLRKNGDEFFLHLSVSEMVVGGEHRFTGILRDITEQKYAEAELIHARREAERSSRAKAAFLANMSHEIRTPMNAVIGFSEVVLRDPALSAESERHLRTIHASARSLLGVINDILDVSKLESGKFALESLAFHLPNLLAETLRTVEGRAAEKGLAMHLQYAPGVPERIVGDPTRLRQVILNLVGNAVKFTEAGAITVSVDLGAAPGSLHFRVADSGIGMTAEQVAKVFDSFSQADDSTSRRFGGTGLGTTICKQLVELMGGEIHADSEAGVGSTFHFTLPLVETAAGDACLFEAGGEVEEGYRSPRRFRVLLAEDIEANATLAMLRLGEQGHTVHWVRNGREAVEAVRTLPYDLVLMDVQMPELDGLGATCEIRSHEAGNGGTRLPILALTASVMREDGDSCLAAGMDGVVPKPIDFPALLRAMEQAVAEGEGEPNVEPERRTLCMGGGAAADFTPLDGVVDHARGMRTWGDAAAYAKALASFAAERADSGEEMTRLLECGDTDSVRAHAHALKGVAGNLALDRVAAPAADIDAALKAGDRPRAAASLAALRSALADAAAAIARLVLPESSRSATPERVDREAARGLLERLLPALDQLDPDAVEPLITELAEQLGEAAVAPLRRGVEAFDFDEVKVCAEALVTELAAEANVNPE